MDLGDENLTLITATFGDDKETERTMQVTKKPKETVENGGSDLLTAIEERQGCLLCGFVHGGDCCHEDFMIYYKEIFKTFIAKHNIVI